MHSFISSSERYIPRGQWLRVGVFALGVFVLFVAAMELRLAAKGFKPTLSDSDWAWRVQRQRVNDLGARALVLVGASRMLLDVDIDVLRQETGLQPVQLAIDGSSFVPVLENLAADPSVRGTVLVSYQDNVVATTEGEATAARFVNKWIREVEGHHLPDFSWTEGALTHWLYSTLRSYADEARPITSLRSRILAAHPTRQYLLIPPDRSWLADYSKVDMPAFYYGRVLRHLEQDVPITNGMTWDEVDAKIRERIANLAPVSAASFAQRSNSIASMVKTIEARGGHVAFVVMPTSGLVREIDEKRYPRQAFWDRFAQAIPAKMLNYADDPSLSTFTCPDGSHLDYRDRAAFTHRLLSRLGMSRFDS